MSCVHNGLQTKLKEIQPNSEYVYCNIHNMKLVVNNSINSYPKAIILHSSNFYTIFGISVKRWDLLSDLTGESGTLKKINTTRWSGRLIFSTTVKARFVDTLKILTKIGFNLIKRLREGAIKIKK